MSEATSGEQAIALVRTVRYDALLLDIHMPGMTGVQTCQEIRKSAPGLGILMLTVRDTEESKIEALDAGADDYLSKPFGVGELLARVRAASRRQQAAGAAHGAIFQFGDVTVDMSLRTVHKGAAAVHLTPIEYRLLSLLVANAGKVLTHRQILREVWGPSHAEDGHYVRVYMGHLRHKLEDDPAQPKHILTETAVGYRLVQSARI